MDTKPTNALLVALWSLCALWGSVLSSGGHCAGGRCFQLFQEPGNFSRAHKRCEDSSGGELLRASSADVGMLLEVLPQVGAASLWLELPAAGGRRARSRACAHVSVSAGRNFTVLQGPCTDVLSGFLCQYLPCSALRADGDARVNYSVPGGFHMHDSAAYPPGSMAEALGVDALHPHSKHLCFFGSWLQAPWRCEVLEGGCRHRCNHSTQACTCPPGQSLQPNNFTCGAEARGRHRQACPEGYKKGPDGERCVDVDECREDPCTGAGEQCHNTAGSYECRCRDGFIEEDGACVDNSICEHCEHMMCNKFQGAYRCECREGHEVMPQDPTRCERKCLGQCEAQCIPAEKTEKKDCTCPAGYILDSGDGPPTCLDINECHDERPCDHTCENLFGSFRCSCDEGFRLEGWSRCVEETMEDETAEPGTTPALPRADALPGSVPPYVKAGSVLGITVFLSLASVLLFMLVHHAAKRCGRFDLAPLKHSNIDIFYLQQVTTDTYKRLSFDKSAAKDAS